MDPNPNLTQTEGERKMKMEKADRATRIQIEGDLKKIHKLIEKCIPEGKDCHSQMSCSEKRRVMENAAEKFVDKLAVLELKNKQLSRICKRYVGKSRRKRSTGNSNGSWAAAFVDKLELLKVFLEDSGFAECTIKHYAERMEFSEILDEEIVGIERGEEDMG